MCIRDRYGSREKPEKDEVRVLVKNKGDNASGLLHTLRERLGFKNIKSMEKGVLWSLAIDPKGNIAAFGPYGADAETIIYVDIELVKRPARGTQWYGR